MPSSSVLNAAALALAFGSAAVSAAQPSSQFGGEQVYFAYTSELTFSGSALAFLDIGYVAVIDVGPARYTRPSLTVPDDGLVLDLDESGGLPQLATNGGALYVLTSASLFGGAGYLSVTHLTVDFGKWTVYADIGGANGLGARTIPFFNLSSVTGDRFSVFENNPLEFVAFGLTLTPEAEAAFIQGLALSSLGTSALSRIHDFGSLKVSGLLLVPEPSTYALMGLGLVSAGFWARRRAVPIRRRAAAISSNPNAVITADEASGTAKVAASVRS